MRDFSRRGFHAAGDVDVGEVEIIGAFCEQAREHRQRRVDTAERDFPRADLPREIDDDVGKRRPGFAHGG